MVKRVCCIILLAVMLAVLLLTGGSAFIPNTAVPIEKYAAELVPFRLVYRSAALIVQAVCIDSVENPDDGNGTFCDYQINYVYAGKKDAGDIIRVRGYEAKGKEKLLYLVPEETEEKLEIQYYEICENGEFSINDNMIILSSGVLLPTEVLKADIRAQQKIKRIPSQYMYYSDFDSLVYGCDEIFIAYVEDISGYYITKCRSSVKGESVEKNCSVAEAGITVLNGLATSRVYGEKINITLVEEMRDYVIDNERLTAVPKQDAKALERGGIYVFFVNYSEDAKEETYFLVNPYQGYLKLDGDELHNCAVNAALGDIRMLPAFTDALYKSLMNKISGRTDGAEGTEAGQA